MTKSRMRPIGIILLSLCVATVYQTGIYGFGVDFYSAYNGSNLSYGSPFHDSLGWRLSTLTLDGLHLGVFLVSFATATATLSLLIFFFEPTGVREVGLTVVAWTFLCHSWPVLMGNLNVMRQALMMSVLFSFLISQGSRLWFKIFLLGLLSPLHKSGLFFLGVYGVSVCLRLMERLRFSHNLRLLLTALGGIATFVVLLNYLGVRGSRVIGADFRIPFFFMNSFLSVIFWFHRRSSKFSNFSFAFNFSAVSVLAAGAITEYERINMVYLIPNMVAVCLLFKRPVRIPLMIVFSASLFVVTMWTGMFSALY